MKLRNDIERAKALMGLYNNTKIVAPMARFTGEYSPSNMTLDEAITYIRGADRGRPFFDYIRGRLIKVTLWDGVEIDFQFYDRDNGAGAGELAVLDELTRPEA